MNMGDIKEDLIIGGAVLGVGVFGLWMAGRALSAPLLVVDEFLENAGENVGNFVDNFKGNVDDFVKTVEDGVDGFKGIIDGENIITSGAKIIKVKGHEFREALPVKAPDVSSIEHIKNLTEIVVDTAKHTSDDIRELTRDLAWYG